MNNHNNKLSNSCEENPKLGHNHRYVKFLSSGLKAGRSGLSFFYKSTILYSVLLKLRLGYRLRRTEVLHEKMAVTS